MKLSSALNKYFSQPQGRVLVVCFIWIAGVFASCQNDIRKLPSDKPIDTEGDKVYNVEFIYSEKGIVKAQLFTKEFIRNDRAKPPYIDMQKGVRVDFFNDSLKTESKLTANYARYYAQNGNILVQGKVKVVNQSGDILETEELIWNQGLEKFYTDKHVKITVSGHVTEGERMEANRDFTWYRITRQRGTIPVESTEMPSE